MTSPIPDPEPDDPADSGGGTAGATGDAQTTPRPGTGSAEEPEQRCDLCGAPMLEWHCRIICTFCGYQRDCSDP
jgi:hypothetical protein